MVFVEHGWSRVKRDPQVGAWLLGMRQNMLNKMRWVGCPPTCSFQALEHWDAHTLDCLRNRPDVTRQAIQREHARSAGNHEPHAPRQLLLAVMNHEKHDSIELQATKK
jgi:hypothetical protein